MVSAGLGLAVLAAATLTACGEPSDPPHARVKAVVVGDIDADGWKDLAIVDHESLSGGKTRASVVSARSGKALFVLEDVHDMAGEVGDIDADGAADLAAVVYRKGTIALEVVSPTTGDVLCTVESDHPGERFGACSAPLGDVDGDGVGDFLVGSEAMWWNELPGHVRACSGRTGETLYEVEGDGKGDGFGGWIARMPDEAGEPERLLVGAPNGARPWCRVVSARTGRMLEHHRQILPGLIRVRFDPIASPSCGTCIHVQARRTSLVEDLAFGGPCCEDLVDLEAGRAWLLQPCGDFDRDDRADWIAEVDRPWVRLSSGGTVELAASWELSRTTVATADLDGDGWEETIAVENQRMHHRTPATRGWATVTVLSGKGGDVLVRWLRSPERLLSLLPR